MDVARLRSQIPTTQRMTYLNTGWAGPSPTPVAQAIEARLEYESERGRTSPEIIESRDETHWKAKEAVASLLNASPSEVHLTQNTTEGLNAVVSGLPWNPGDEIVTFDLEHPGVLLPALQLQKTRGVRARVLRISADVTHDQVLARLDGALNERTRMVIMSHIEYSSGLRMPVKEIGELAHRRGAWLLLDGAQTAGHVTVDVRDLDCDFYSIPGQKWLLGPDQTGALYIREDLIPLIEPTGIGYRSAERVLYPDGYELRKDIDKLRVSSTSAALRAGLLAAIGFVQDVGTKRIEERNLSLASSLKAGLASITGVTVLSPMDGPGCSGLVSFTVDRMEPEEAVARLWDSHRVLVREVPYPSCVRASLDFFNTEEEVERVVEAVRAMAASS